MCRAAPSAHGSPPTKNRRSRKNREIARKSLHRSAGAPPFNVQHTRTDREEDPATRAVRRPRATPLSLSQPFSPGRRRCSGAGPAPRSAPTATVPLLRRDVHFALENDGWNCTFECEVHVSAPGGVRRGLRPPRGAPPRGTRRRRLSKSVAKARIEPGPARRIVDIPRFFSPPIPSWGAFAADLDTPRPRNAPGAPPAPSRARPPASPRRSGPAGHRSR